MGICCQDSTTVFKKWLWKPKFPYSFFKTVVVTEASTTSSENLVSLQVYGALSMTVFKTGNESFVLESTFCSSDTGDDMDLIRGE